MGKMFYLKEIENTAYSMRILFISEISALSYCSGGTRIVFETAGQMNVYHAFYRGNGSCLDQTVEFLKITICKNRKYFKIHGNFFINPFHHSPPLQQPCVQNYCGYSLPMFLVITIRKNS